MLSRGGAPIAVVNIPVVVVQAGGVAAVAVYRQSWTFQLWRRGKFGVQTARKPSSFHGCSFQQFLRRELTGDELNLSQ